MSDDDRDLREAFARMRREDSARSGDFRSHVGAALRRPVQRGPLVPALLAGAAFVALAFLLGRALLPTHAPPDAHPLQLAQWVEPTAFLLKTHGSELLTTLPDLARPPSAPTPTPEARSN